MANSVLAKRESGTYHLTKETVDKKSLISSQQTLSHWLMALLCDDPDTSIYIATKLLKLWSYTTEPDQLKHIFLFVNMKYRLFYLLSI
jgi:hypothetical protein